MSPGPASIIAQPAPRGSKLMRADWRILRFDYAAGRGRRSWENGELWATVRVLSYSLRCNGTRMILFVRVFIARIGAS